MYWLIQTICKTLALREIMLKLLPIHWNVSLIVFYFFQDTCLIFKSSWDVLFLSRLVCIVKYPVARFWIRWFRQRGSGADDIGQFPLTSVFFFYVLKFLLAKILSFLTLCVIPQSDPPHLKEDLSYLGMCCVLFPYVLRDLNVTKQLKRRLGLQSDV